MLLYHASNTIVKHPVVVNRFATLDFGTGFYTTTNRDQACDFARKVFVRRGRKGAPAVSVYEFDSQAARTTLEVLEFRQSDEAWLEFVVHNRAYGRDPKCTADIIIGPVANDDVFETVALYERGQIDAQAAVKRFKVKELFDQVLFCNMDALAFLSFVEPLDVEGADG